MKFFDIATLFLCMLPSGYGRYQGVGHGSHARHYMELEIDELNFLRSEDFLRRPIASVAAGAVTGSAPER